MPVIPKSFLAPGAISERMGLFAFSRNLDKGRPPPDVEAIPRLSTLPRGAAEMEMGEWLALQALIFPPTSA
jgi:hypothetical protein